MNIPFLPRVRKTVERHEMLEVGDRVLVAVSGGPDSVALLHVLLTLRPEYELSLAVAHLDHGLRRESKDDAQFVRRMASDLGLAFYPRRADVAGFSKRKKLCLEEGAREARYAFLEEAARKARASKIAIGHTLDDQAETVLMRLVRGAGPKGLEGIPPVRGKFIRPLIGVKREEIIQFLERNEIPYLSDPSNRDLKFTRNRVRLRLLPLLEKEFNPRIVETLARTGQLLVSERVRGTRGKQGWEDPLAERREGKTTKIVLELSKVLGYNKWFQQESVREAIRRIRGDLRGIAFAHTEAVLGLFKSRTGKVVELPGGFRARRGYREVVFERNITSEAVRAFDLPVEVPGITPCPGGLLRTSLISFGAGPPKRGGRIHRAAWLDARKIHFPLRVRTRKEGDRFWPLGLPGPKRLKEVLINDKIPRKEREGLLLLADQEGILWIVGQRTSERAKLTGETKRVLKVTFVPYKKHAG